MTCAPAICSTLCLCNHDCFTQPSTSREVLMYKYLQCSRRHLPSTARFCGQCHRLGQNRTSSPINKGEAGSGGKGWGLQDAEATLSGLELPQKGTRVIKRVLWDACWWKGAGSCPAVPQVHHHFHHLPGVKKQWTGARWPRTHPAALQRLGINLSSESRGLILFPKLLLS